MFMQFFSSFSSLQFDIVGIVAILGEGSISRNAQASALSWYHTLPRIYPAPQSLLKHHQDKTLPTEPGVVIGAHSGRIRNEINFFAQLLHHEDLPPYSVQLLEVERKKPSKPVVESNADSASAVMDVPAFEVRKMCHLTYLSVLGLCMSVTLLGLSIWQRDGRALLATVFLSATSSLVGFASWGKLNREEEVPAKARQGVVPLGDIVIFYPRTASFRVVRCSDQDSRLYFRYERFEHLFDDNQYRCLALFASVALMCGLIMLGNASASMQAAFAASYILLNTLYWASSARDPFEHVWKHDYQIEELGFTKKMISTVSGGKVSIEPLISELSPPRGNLRSDGKTAVIEEASLPYFNAHWKLRRLEKASTFSAIARPGEQYELRDTSGQSRITDFFSRRRAVNPKSQKKDSLVAANRTMLSALWTVIALTGSSRWARTSNLAPDNAVWDMWLKEAEDVASSKWSRAYRCYLPACRQWEEEEAADGKKKRWISLPDPKWDYQARLSELFKQHSAKLTERWESPIAIHRFEESLARIQQKVRVVTALRLWIKRFREKKAAEGNSSQSQSSIATGSS